MIFKKTIYLNNLNQTKNLAKVLVFNLKWPIIILLLGPVGIGKTQFVKFFASFLGIKNVNSPSFIKMQIYSTVQNKKLIHFDGFHMKGVSDFNQFLDYFDADYLLLEWPEKIIQYFDSTETVSLHWYWINDNQRVVKIESCYRISGIE